MPPFLVFVDGHYFELSLSQISILADCPLCRCTRTTWPEMNMNLFKISSLICSVFVNFVASFADEFDAKVSRFFLAVVIPGFELFSVSIVRHTIATVFKTLGHFTLIIHDTPCK